MRSLLFQDIKQVLSSRMPRSLEVSPDTRLASVLIAFYEHEDQPYLLFLKRPDGEYVHAGQVAFPGGKRECHESAVECALREAEEEVGIQRGDVTILGVLDDFDTVVTRFCITPVVGVIPFPYPFRLQSREVERLIHVSLEQLLDERSFRQEKVFVQERVHGVHFYTAGSDVIWGATAGMVSSLLRIIRQLGIPERKIGQST